MSPTDGTALTQTLRMSKQMHNVAHLVKMLKRREKKKGGLHFKIEKLFRES